MHASCEKVPVQEACSLFGFSRQAYYKSLSNKEESILREHVILEMVRDIRLDMPLLGGRKLYHKLCERYSWELLPGRDAFFNLLRRHGLLVRRRRQRPYTTDSRHPLHKYPNLIREFVPSGPDQLYVSDITYIEIEKGKYYYLAIITDAYSRKIVGWWLSEDLKAASCIKALWMALKEHDGKTPLIHHSDRGSQYCSIIYTDLLKERNVAISMTEKGDPLENAIAERVNGILKTEWLNHMGPLGNITQARKKVAHVIDLYNNERPHMSINMLTPEEAHQREGLLPRMWKNYYTYKNEIQCSGK